MVILYLRTFVRYGPLLRSEYNYLHKSDFGSTSISICSKFLASPKLNLPSLTLAFFSLYSDIRFQTSKIVPLLWLPSCVTEIRRCLWTALCYMFVSRRSRRPLAHWWSRLQYKVITYIRITLLQFYFTLLLFGHIFPLVIAFSGVNAFFFLKCYFCEKLGCNFLLSWSPKFPISRVYCMLTVIWFNVVCLKQKIARTLLKSFKGGRF